MDYIHTKKESKEDTKWKNKNFREGIFKNVQAAIQKAWLKIHLK